MRNSGQILFLLSTKEKLLPTAFLRKSSMQSLLAEAILQAKLSECSVRHGCVIAKGRKLLAKSPNKYCQRLGGKSIPTGHSEFVALNTLRRSRSFIAKSSPKKQWREKFGSLRGSGRLQRRTSRLQALQSLSSRIAALHTFSLLFLF